MSTIYPLGSTPEPARRSEMTDQEFLTWLANRLVNVYGESPNVDFVHKLRAIAQATPIEQATSWP